MVLEGKRVLITGGTGSLGKVLIRRILTGEFGKPAKVIVYSRDEAKQHYMRLSYQKRSEAATDEVIYRNFQQLLTFRIGDVRNFHATAAVLREADIVFNAAALKQVPACEYFPYEAVETNIGGPENIVRAIRDLGLPVKTVVGVSTDKACKPVNVMGMTKAIQERVFLRANIDLPDTRFVAVRYGNVLASRGSVIPYFHEQIKNGGPVTITDPGMTRFLLSLNQAVDTIMAAAAEAKRGETYIPRVPAAKVTDVAKVLIGDRKIETKVTGIRPGEKLHEIMISEEEANRTVDRGKYYAILPILPELIEGTPKLAGLTKEYSSGDSLMTEAETAALLKQHKLMVEDNMAYEDELLR